MAATNWTDGGADNLWTTSGNWDNGVPGASDDAYIDGNYLVQFDDDHSSTGKDIQINSVSVDHYALLMFRTTQNTVMRVIDKIYVGSAGMAFVEVGGDNGGDPSGTYTVASVTNDNAIELGAAPADASDRLITMYVRRGNPRVLALLHDGEESGGYEVLNVQDNGAGEDPMKSGGTSFTHGGSTFSGDSTATLADGTIQGARKAVWALAGYTTNDLDLTITNCSVSAPEHLFFKSADDLCVLRWLGSAWMQVTSNVPTST